MFTKLKNLDDRDKFYVILLSVCGVGLWFIIRTILKGRAR